MRNTRYSTDCHQRAVETPLFTRDCQGERSTLVTTMDFSLAVRLSKPENCFAQPPVSMRPGLEEPREWFS